MQNKKTIVFNKKFTKIIVIDKENKMGYPKAPDRKIQKISNLLTKYAESQGIDFSFGDDQVSPTEVFAFFGALSLFLVEAKEIYEKLYNNLYTVEELMSSFDKKIKELNLEQTLKEESYLSNKKKDKVFPIELHQKEQETYFGFIPRITSEKVDFYILAHFSLFAVEEYVKQYMEKPILLVDGKVPLDPLYEKIINKLNSKQISIVPQSTLLNAINKNELQGKD